MCRETKSAPWKLQAMGGRVLALESIVKDEKKQKEGTEAEGAEKRSDT